MSIDQVPLPSTDGALWLCGLADIVDDPVGVLAFADGSSTVVCLNERDELERRFPTYAEWVRENKGGAVLWYPIRNFSAPGAGSMMPFLRMITKRLEAGEGVVMHCALGQGRAGTIAVCVLMLLGASLDEAITTVARHRTFAGPGERSQWRLVEEVAVELSG